MSSYRNFTVGQTKLAFASVLQQLNLCLKSRPVPQFCQAKFADPTVTHTDVAVTV